MKRMLCGVGFIFGVIALTPNAVSAQTNVMFIFDASGSMRASIGTESRIVAAKRAFSDALAAMPADIRVGLIAFGHRRRRDCSDLEVISPIGADRPTVLASIVQKFEALGETPIANAIDRAGDTMRAFAGHNNAVVLLTDGIEECGGDPCAAARRLTALGIDVKVHVIGFALRSGQGRELQCITETTGGRYFDAGDARQLSRALQQVQQQVTQAPAPPAAPPQTPTRKVIFSEDFNGSDLNRDTWEVLNENKDFYIVENGALMMVGPDVADFVNPKTMNIFRLNQELPNTNWDIVVNARVQTQTGADNFLIGLYTDDKNFLSARLVREAESRHTLRIARQTGEQVTRAQSLLTSTHSFDNPPGGTENQGEMAKVLGTDGVRLVISKRERRYTASIEIRNWRDQKDRPRRVVTQDITSLRVPGRFAMAIGKHDPKRAGESIAFIEKVEIIAVD